jgi:hypothetical protein
LAAAALMAAVGCSKDKEVVAILGEIDAFTSELVKKVEAGGDAGAGIDDAQRYLDSRKAEMRSRLASLTSVKGYQVRKETTAKVTECAARNLTAVGTLQIKHALRAAQDAAFRDRLRKLVSDYQALLKP